MKKFALLAFLFLHTSVMAESFIVFEENGKMGIKNEEGQVIVPASFEALGWSDGSFSVISNVTGYRLNNQWGILNLKKEFVTKADFETLVYASGEFVVARKRISPVQTKTGCLNLKGEIKIPFQYDGISIHGLRAVVFNLIKAQYVYGLVDLQNHLIIPLQYKNIYPLGTLRFAVENRNGKIGLVGEDGRAIIDFKIDSISQFYKSRAIIYQNLKQGLIDRDGKILVEPNYLAIKIVDEDKVALLMPHEWLLINEKNETQLNFFADELFPAEDGITIYSNGNRYGLLDATLNVVLTAHYDNLTPLGNNYYRAQKNQKTGVIRSDNSISIPLLYDSLDWSEKLFRAFKKASGWSLVTIDNEIKTQKNYDWIGDHQQGLYPIKNNGFWGALNSEGEEIIHCVFDSLHEILEERLAVKFRGQYGIIDSKENWLVAPQPFQLQLVNDSCYLELQPQNKFLRTFAGEIIYFTDNRVEFKNNTWIESLADGTIKTLDYQGRLLNRADPPKLDKLEKVFLESEGMRGIKRDGKFGFVDSRGRLRIANRYDGIGDFSEGLAAIKLLGKWGFIDLNDQIVINPNFESVGKFTQGISIISKNGKAGAIDQNGKIVLALHYDSVHLQPNKKLHLHKNGLIGLADQQGRILIEPRFDYLHELENGFVITGREGKFGLISVTGLSVIPPIYDALSFDATRNQYLALKKSDWKEISVK